MWVGSYVFVQALKKGEIVHIKDPKTGGDLYVMRTLKVSDMQSHTQGRKGTNRYTKPMGVDDELLSMNMEILNDAREIAFGGVSAYRGSS